MTKGTIFIENNLDAERLTTLLATNGYTVRYRQVEGFDAYTFTFQIDYKRKEEDDEP